MKIEQEIWNEIKLQHSDISWVKKIHPKFRFLTNTFFASFIYAGHSKCDISRKLKLQLKYFLVSVLKSSKFIRKKRNYFCSFKFQCPASKLLCKVPLLQCNAKGIKIFAKSSQLTQHPYLALISFGILNILINCSYTEPQLF